MKPRQYQRKFPLSTMQKEVLESLASEKVNPFTNALDIYGIKTPLA